MKTQLTFGKLWGATWPLILVALAVNGLIVAIALQWVNVPPDVSASLDYPMLLPASIFPVLGSAFGFFMSYRKLNAASLPLFIGIGSAITAAFIVLAILDYTGDDGHDNLGVLITVLVVTITPTVIAIVGLLRRKDDLIGMVAAPAAGYGVPAATPGGIPPLGGACAPAAQGGIPPLGGPLPQPARPPRGPGRHPAARAAAAATARRHPAARAAAAATARRHPAARAAQPQPPGGIPPLGQPQPQPQPADLSQAARTGVWQRPQLRSDDPQNPPPLISQLPVRHADPHQRGAGRWAA